MTHKPRIWRDIDKHPLPDENCRIDLKLECGSIMIGCNYDAYNNAFSWVRHSYWDAEYLCPTQWRDAK
jgi:hypothetical protein